MTTDRLTMPMLCSMLVLVPGCAALLSGTSIQERHAAEAEADELLQHQIDFLQKRPVEPWSADDASRTLLQATIAVNQNVPEDADQLAYRKPRLAKLHQAWTDFFARAHQSAMSEGDPELAQGLTGTQMILQEEHDELEWFAARTDVMARFREEADAMATYRKGVFEKRSEYAKLNEFTCIASDKPFEPINKPQPNLRWHFEKNSEIHVRCLFPTTLRSQVSGGLSYSISGELNINGTRGEGRGNARLVRTTFKIPVEVAGFIDAKYFDFAFDLSAQTKGMKWGFVRVDGNVEWVTGSEEKGLEKHMNSAFTRVSFE